MGFWTSRLRRNAIDFVGSRNVVFIRTLKLPRRYQRDHNTAQKPRAPRSNVPCYGIGSIASSSDINSARTKMRDDEPGDETGEEPDPGGQKDGERGHL